MIMEKVVREQEKRNHNELIDGMKLEWYYGMEFARFYDIR